MADCCTACVLVDHASAFAPIGLDDHALTRLVRELREVRGLSRVVCLATSKDMARKLVILGVDLQVYLVTSADTRKLLHWACFSGNVLGASEGLLLVRGTAPFLSRGRMEGCVEIARSSSLTGAVALGRSTEITVRSSGREAHGAAVSPILRVFWPARAHAMQKLVAPELVWADAHELLDMRNADERLLIETMHAAGY